MATESKPNLPATIAKANLPTGGKIAAIVPMDIDQAYRLSKAIALSGMAPKSYGGDENKIMVGIMHGMEVGMTPMVALQSIANINGMPSLWGDGALGLVQASGLLEDIEETLAGTGDDMVATCRAVRKGRHTPIIRTFSMRDAITAGLKGKQGPWTTNPKRMLQMRARGFTLRDGFPDVLRGLGIREEVQDMGNLVEGSDGSYGSAPPRPTRADYQEPERQVEDEPEAAPKEYAYEAYNHWGECALKTDDPVEFANEVIGMLDSAPDRRTVDTVIENNAKQPTDVPADQVKVISAAVDVAMARTEPAKLSAMAGKRSAI